MPAREEINEIVLRDKERRLSISRVPKKTKELFVKLANDEFADDFGLTLKFCLDQAKEYQAMKITFFDNINMKLDLLLNQESQSQPKEQYITKRMLGGREIKIKKKEVENE